MIHDTLANAARYKNLDARLIAALRWSAMLDPTQPDGRRGLDGDDLFATAMSYETKVPVNRMQEAHRRYTDLQVMLHGEERILFTPAGSLGVGNGYHPEKDYELFEFPAEHSVLRLRAGEFVIFFPGEGHQTSLALDAPELVRKIVVKVRIR